MVDANKWPKAVEEAVDQLVSTMSKEDLETLRNTSEKDLILCHFGLGAYVRNEQEKAALTILEQAELLCKDWAM